METQPSFPDVHRSITIPGVLVEVEVVAPTAGGSYTMYIGEQSYAIGDDTVTPAVLVRPAGGTCSQDAVQRE